MMKRVYIAILFLILFNCISLAAPEPAVVPGPEIWTLNTDFTAPKSVVMQRTDNNQLLRYWYIIITITNNAGQDINFYPKCDLMTDTFQITAAGHNVPTAVFNQIKERHKSQYPFLEQFGLTDNTILQGEDNTKDIVIIWPDFDSNAREFDIFISGLSNETKLIDHPIAKDENGNPQQVYLSKTLVLKYNIKGDPASGANVSIDYISKKWVMR